MSRRADDGLRAVARVREVRERDSRLGLQHAADVVRDREAALVRREQALATAPRFTHGTVASFVGARLALTAMTEAVGQAGQQLETGRTLAAVARERWQDDTTRLNAVELLLERRESRRREERRRDEDRELDDVAGRLWLRARRGEGHGEAS